MIGFVCGAFDLLHAGHIHLLKVCKQNCKFLIVGLHVDPSLQRPSKNKPVESLLERMIRLKGCKYVDQVVVYETEEDLALILKHYKIDVRFLGTDYTTGTKPVTEPNAIPIKYIDSLPITSSNLRERIKRS